MSRSIIDSSLIPMISPLIKFFLDWVCTILSEIIKCLVVGANTCYMFVFGFHSTRIGLGRYIVHGNSKSFFFGSDFLRCSFEIDN